MNKHASESFGSSHSPFLKKEMSEMIMATAGLQNNHYRWSPTPTNHQHTKMHQVAKEGKANL